MESRIKKFLEFNGKVLYFVANDGKYWIALRPICEALGVNFSNELRRVKKHGIFGTNVVNITMMDAQNRLFKMASLQEKYIYGWISRLDSDLPAFLDFQLKCYDLLYEYFHGSITSRHQALMNKSESIAKAQALIEKLSTIPEFQELNNARAEIMRIGKKLKELDDELIHGQLSINFNQSN